MPAKRQPRPFKRAGLHVMRCECGAYAYFTVAQLETAGRLPACFRAGCDGTLEPDELELAFLLGADSAAVVAEYQRRVSNSERAQCRSIGWERVAERLAAGDPTLNSMTVNTAAVMARERRDRARSNRLGALKPAAEPMPF